MRKFIPGAAVLAAATGIALAFPVAAQAAPAPAPHAATSGHVTTAPACAKPLHAGGPVCYSEVRTDITAVHANALSPHATPSGYGPSDLRSAYNLTSAASSNGGGATVAVVENADDPNLESDLATYRSQYGLAACTTANGCFSKVNQSGQQGNYPAGDTGWGTEASLDVDMVSAICPNCHILVVEAGDLAAAQNTAVSLGAHFISNSWGTGDGSGDSSMDADFNHAGVVDVASSGDSGYGVSFPASSRYVVAAGGTTLNRASSSRGWSESAWSGAGAGCSSWEGKPSWQTDSGCGNRTVADVSAIADPGTGVAVYDTYGQGGWFVVGGTSVSSPIIASVFALAGAPASNAASVLYANRGDLNDVTSGSDGSCSPSYLCNGSSGYDGPTGLGTPNGLGAFNGSAGGGTTGATGAITAGVNSSLCVDDRSSSTADYNPVQLWGCNGSSAQQWTVGSGNTLQVLGKCLDVYAAGTADGTLADLYDCNGTGAQVWQPQSDGALLNPASGKCLDDPNSSTAAGTQLQIWDCNGSSAQHWTLP
ncbi:ricin-type beta-trefoil lectin domain protein [Streptomyces sp. SL13]|uniref:Ricin-type beta-trefoil lectin domain protein n=1 Tax=Streptantibioticus silvisoli TaxID=2705255 RepID=A0AA90JY55_9ACTN|nr:ricin-type beta-trefoil lectin domain protein [Streptantibioticus silvisoli]MDI5964641.1 ricin-type beta-trefoil lectin domain protein [Streptantibioticus silvisoli]MDI5970856.1 ricin-type beta-trefoil lectin domain protein [Streptantibioticus silvisoli]